MNLSHLPFYSQAQLNEMAALLERTCNEEPNISSSANAEVNKIGDLDNRVRLVAGCLCHHKVAVRERAVNYFEHSEKIETALLSWMVLVIRDPNGAVCSAKEKIQVEITSTPEGNSELTAKIRDSATRVLSRVQQLEQTVKFELADLLKSDEGNVFHLAETVLKKQVKEDRETEKRISSLLSSNRPANETVQVRILKLLKELKTSDSEALTPVIALLANRETSETLSAWCVKILKDAEPKTIETLSPVIALLTSEHASVRLRATSILEQVKLEIDIWEKIIPLLQKEDSAIQSTVSFLIKKKAPLGGDLIDMITSLLTNSSITVRAVAADLLSDIRLKDQEKLVNILNLIHLPDESVRWFAVFVVIACLKKMKKGENEKVLVQVRALLNEAEPYLKEIGTSILNTVPI